jgi:hypothetical protein
MMLDDEAVIVLDRAQLRELLDPLWHEIRVLRARVDRLERAAYFSACGTYTEDAER